MTPWNLQTTKTLVAARHDELQTAALWASLQSIHKRKYIAGYHYHEYKRLLREQLDPRLINTHPLDLLIGLDGDDRWSFQTFELQVTAHVMACMQSMHALADTLAFAIAQAFGLNLGPNALPESVISISSVATRLETHFDCSPVYRTLKEIQTHPHFSYLADVVNHSKHRSLVTVDFHFDAMGEPVPPYKLRMAPFTFKTRTHAEREVSSFLEPLYAWLSPTIVSCGNELNAVLTARQA